MSLSHWWNSTVSDTQLLETPSCWWGSAAYETHLVLRLSYQWGWERETEGDEADDCDITEEVGILRGAGGGMTKSSLAHWRKLPQTLSVGKFVAQLGLGVTKL